MDKQIFNNKIGSIIICPICGGPTHVSRDTGDFTCDHCGKIIVRANKNNLIIGFLETPNTTKINDFLIKETMRSETREYIKLLKSRGWVDFHLNGEGHYEGFWPYAPKKGDPDYDWRIGNRVTFANTPSDRKWKQNSEKYARRVEKTYPRPIEQDSNVDIDKQKNQNDNNDDNTTTASMINLSASKNYHCDQCKYGVPYQVRLNGPGGNIFQMLADIQNALREHESDDKFQKIYDNVTNSSSYEEALNHIKYDPVLRVRMR